MKKLGILIVSLLLIFSLTACGTSPEPLNLDGTWVQEEQSETYHEAVIEGDTITINWVDPEENSRMLYWAGSVDIPSEDVLVDSEYSWESKNDKEKTDEALLSSGDDMKKFTYKDGVISYEASAFGVTKTIELKKVEK